MAGTNPSTADPATGNTVAAQAKAALPEQTPLADAFPELDTPDDAASEAAAAPRPTGRNIDAMLNVDLRVQVILGHARMPISQLLKLSRGSVIELDRRIGDPVDVIINDRLVARGDLVKLPGDRIGVSLTEIIKDYVLDN